MVSVVFVIRAMLLVVRRRTRLLSSRHFVAKSSLLLLSLTVVTVRLSRYPRKGRALTECTVSPETNYDCSTLGTHSLCIDGDAAIHDACRACFNTLFHSFIVVTYITEYSAVIHACNSFPKDGTTHPGFTGRCIGPHPSIWGSSYW